MEVLKLIGFMFLLVCASVDTVMSIFVAIWVWCNMSILVAAFVSIVLIVAVCGWWIFAKDVFERMKEKRL